MDENPYKATVNITKYEANVTRRPPRQVSYLRGFVLLVALIFGQAAVIMLALAVQGFSNPERGPSEVRTYASCFVIAAIISFSLFWLSQNIEASRQVISTAPTDETGDSK